MQERRRRKELKKKEEQEKKMQQQEGGLVDVLPAPDMSGAPALASPPPIMPSNNSQTIFLCIQILFMMLCLQLMMEKKSGPVTAMTETKRLCLLGKSL